MMMSRLKGTRSFAKSKGSNKPVHMVESVEPCWFHSLSKDVHPLKVRVNHMRGVTKQPIMCDNAHS